MELSLGISTCPNDTFTFHGLLTGAVTCPGVEFRIELMDVQQLNDAIANESLDISKVSFAAALRHTDRYAALSAGAALGYGVGPLLLKRRGAPALGQGAKVLCPGAGTTAAMLFKYFYPIATPEISHVVFSEIMPALSDGAADYGVVIHEGRFTYAESGLELVADLGTLWEQEFRAPLPLGGIVGRKSLGRELLTNVSTGILRSLEYSFSHRDEAFETMRLYAQELNPEVIWAHVDLYVNQWSFALGQEGMNALRSLEQVARQAEGLLAHFEVI